MKSESSMDRVVINFPTVLPVHLSADTPARSWIQLAKVGSFTSNRYGKFSITPGDLAQMLANFRQVFPKPPTELPIDFDHLSMDPKQPGDGLAAGWIKHLELRADGTELWGEVAWTPRAEAAIRNREYQFVSPSFVKDYTDSESGKQIGTTLLAAAITNHPFLQSMKAVSLCTEAVHGNLAINEAGMPPQEPTMSTTPPPVPRPYSLAETGQKVTFVDDILLTPELSASERASVYTVVATSDAGDFVKLKNTDDEEYGWYPTSVLAPAPAPDKDALAPAPMDEQIPTTPEEAAALQQFLTADQATTALFTLASTLATDRGISFGAATKLASAQRPDLVQLRNGETPEPPPAAATPPPAPDAASFYALVMDLKRERQIGDLDAVLLAQTLRPDLALAYREEY